MKLISLILFASLCVSCGIESVSERRELNTVKDESSQSLVSLNSKKFNTCSSCECASPSESCLNQLGEGFQLAEGQASCDEAKVPEGCFSLEGTTEKDIAWLEEYRQNPSASGELLCGAIQGCDMYTSNLEMYAKACKQESTTHEKILCMSKKIKAFFAVNKKKVCRHHAVCLKKGAKLMGLHGSLEVGYKASQCGHAWYEYKQEKFTYIYDSYNSIYYMCRR